MSADNQVKIQVQVRPGAAKNQVTGFAEGVWQVKVAAPPVEGKANRELVEFLSKTLGVSKSSITILKGLTSRRKLVAIAGLSPEAITDRLLPAKRLLP